MQEIPQRQETSSQEARPETVLVTGGSGYVAGWIITQSLRCGFQVRTTVRDLSREEAVRHSVASQVNSKGRLEFFPADLLKDEGWSEALSGCAFVIHVASPMGQGDSKADLVTPAREGTLRILKVAAKVGVQRVVVTSSTVAAAAPGKPETAGPHRVNENTWTNPAEKGLGEYGKSKTLAEQAAWEFINQHSGPLTMTTVLPGMILGPVLSRNVTGSVEVISRMLAGRVPALPRIGFSVVHVRDLADLHLKAMLAPEAAGHRFLGVGDFLWMVDMAKLLREHLGEKASKVPTRVLPDFALRIAALFQQEARFMVPMLGKRTEFDISKAARLLNWHPRPASEVVLDCANDLIRKRII